MTFAPSTLRPSQSRRCIDAVGRRFRSTLFRPTADGADTRAAGRTLGAVGAVGVVVALLTWRVADIGFGCLVADAVLVGAILGGVGQARLRASEVLLAAASLWLAGATAWYASDWAIATAFPASAVTLAMLALVRARRIGMSGLSFVGAASIDALRAFPGGIVDAARTPVRAVGASGRTRFFGVLRGTLVGLPLAGLFTLLLSADSGFRQVLGRMIERSGDGLELAMWTGATTSALLVAYAVLARLGRPRLDPVPAAWLAIPYRAEGDAPAPFVPPAGPRVRTLTWGVALSHVVAVFGVYVIANAGTLFAGHAHLRAHGTVTYAEYLHEGFAQVSIATLLAVACVVAGHALLRPRSGTAASRAARRSRHRARAARAGRPHAGVVRASPSAVRGGLRLHVPAPRRLVPPARRRGSPRDDRGALPRARAGAAGGPPSSGRASPSRSSRAR